MSIMASTIMSMMENATVKKDIMERMPNMMIGENMMLVLNHMNRFNKHRCPHRKTNTIKLQDQPCKLFC
eukprot:3644956-Prorocentrum_lima.AAC.1